MKNNFEPGTAEALKNKTLEIKDKIKAGGEGAIEAAFELQKIQKEAGEFLRDEAQSDFKKSPTFIEKEIKELQVEVMKNLDFLKKCIPSDLDHDNCFVYTVQFAEYGKIAPEFKIMFLGEEKVNDLGHKVRDKKVIRENTFSRDLDKHLERLQEILNPDFSKCEEGQDGVVSFYMFKAKDAEGERRWVQVDDFLEHVKGSLDKWVNYYNNKKNTKK